MEITLIATDLDGTLLSDESTVSDENLEAIERLDKNELYIVPVTGRTFYEIPEKIRKSGAVRYFVYSNGAGIYDKKKGMIYYAPIESDTAREIFKLLSKYETLIEVYTGGHPCINEKQYGKKFYDYFEIDEAFKKCMVETRVPTKNFEHLLDDGNIKAEMFDVFFKNLDERAECMEILKEKYPDVEVTGSMFNNLEIMKKGVNKGKSLEKLCKHLCVNMNLVIAMGDSKNDLTMFSSVGTRLAVDNACDDLKNVADKVICKNNENIFDYLRKHLGV